jgi:hypothetical protein
MIDLIPEQVTIARSLRGPNWKKTRGMVTSAVPEILGKERERMMPKQQVEQKAAQPILHYSNQ